MTTPLARGLIITFTLLVAAGVAAYESDSVREWLEKTKTKIAMNMRPVGDEDGRKSHNSRSDISMMEEKTEKAQRRRQQARQEIMERGRLMEERRQKRTMASPPSSEQQEKRRTSSFDTLVDESGMLRPQLSSHDTKDATMSSLFESVSEGERTKPEHSEFENVSADKPVGESSTDHLPQHQQVNSSQSQVLFDSEYERELRESWNLPLPPIPSSREILSTHDSESLIDFTPTTENVPDPDFSIPSASTPPRSPHHSDYFSVPPSNRSQTLQNSSTSESAAMATPATSDVLSHIHRSEAVDSDDESSIFGEGIRTPGSVWTEVDSNVSGSH